MIDSRASKEGATIRRRRECLHCEHRFTTYEEIEREQLVVLKRDGRREPFSKEKLRNSIERACQKRPVSGPDIDAAVASARQAFNDARWSGKPPAVRKKVLQDNATTLFNLPF